MHVTSFSLDIADVRELAFLLAREPESNPTPRRWRHAADAAWSASVFLASVARAAERTRRRLDRAEATRILGTLPEAPSLESLEAKHRVRFVLGRLEIPSAVAFALHRDDDGIVAPDTHAGLDALYRARYDDGPPLWVDRAVLEKVHEAHRAAHPATPTIDDLVHARVLGQFRDAGRDGFSLAVQTTAEPSLWRELSKGIAAAYWALLLRDTAFPSDGDRLSAWLHFVEDAPDVADSVREMERDSANRLLDAARDTIFSEPDLLDPEKELTRVRWESELAVRGNWDLPPPPGAGSTALERWEWWEPLDDLLVRERCRETVNLLIALIVRFDPVTTFSDHRCERVAALLRAADERPHLAREVPLFLMFSRPDALAWLVAHADLASLGMALLLRRPLANSPAGERLDFESRRSSTEARRTAHWVAATRIVVSAAADTGAERARSLADVLLVLARSAYGTAKRSGAASIETALRVRRTFEIVSSRGDLVRGAAAQTMHDRVVSEARAATLARPSFASIPTAELAVLFFLADVADTTTGFSLERPATSVVDLYQEELERLLCKEGSVHEPVHWVDHSPRVAELGWGRLVERVGPGALLTRLLKPVDFAALAKAAAPMATSMTREKEAAEEWARTLVTSAIRKARCHLAVLCGAHRALLEQRPDRAVLGPLEEAIVWVLETCAAGNASQEIPPLFDDDVAFRIGRGDADEKLAPAVIATLNAFTDEHRSTAFERWIDAEPSPAILLTLLADALPIAARQRVQDRLKRINLDAALKGIPWIPQVEAVIDAALEARDFDVAKRALDFGDTRVKAGPRRAEWEQWTFTKRLILAYYAKDAEAIAQLPAPKQTLAGDDYDPERTRDFYRALLLLESAPEQARDVFEAQLRERPELGSLAVNRFAADLRVAMAAKDLVERSTRLERALAEWETFAAQIPAEALSHVEENASYSRLFALDQLQTDGEFDLAWHALATILKRKLEFVSIAVGNARRRGMTTRAGEILMAARPYHLATDGKPTADFVAIEQDTAPANPGAGAKVEVLRSREELARLRSVFREEVMGLPARDLVRVVGAGGELHEFLFEALVLSSQEMLERRFILKDPTEDRYSDLIVSMLRMRVLQLGWSVRDQSRGGASAEGKDAGRRDWIVLAASGMSLAIFEALCLDSVRTGKIDEHVQRLAMKYDALGLAQGFIVVYADAKNPDAFWDTYATHVRGLTLNGFEIVAGDEPDLGANLPRAMRACRVTYAKDGTPYVLYHLVVFCS